MHMRSQARVQKKVKKAQNIKPLERHTMIKDLNLTPIFTKDGQTYYQSVGDMPVSDELQKERAAFITGIKAGIRKKQQSEQAAQVVDAAAPPNQQAAQAENATASPNPLKTEG